MLGDWASCQCFFMRRSTCFMSMTTCSKSKLKRSGDMKRVAALSLMMQAMDSVLYRHEHWRPSWSLKRNPAKICWLGGPEIVVVVRDDAGVVPDEGPAAAPDRIVGAACTAAAGYGVDPGRHECIQHGLDLAAKKHCIDHRKEEPFGGGKSDLPCPPLRNCCPAVSGDVE